MSSHFVNNCHDVSNLYKYMNMLNADKEFWEITGLLTHNKPIMCVTSGRSVGKSTNVACFLLLDYIVNSFEFIYTRRTDKELALTRDTFFNNATELINRKIPNIFIQEIKVERNHYIIKYVYDPSREAVITEDTELEYKECGIAIPLNLEGQYKSNAFPPIGTILYDEFMPKDRTKYLGSLDKDPEKEPRLFNSLYGTVDRGIDVPFASRTRAILLGNTETIYNPFFVHWGIIPYLYKDKKAKIISPKDKVWLLNRVDGVEATSHFKNSILYAISSDIDKKYNFENDGSDDFNDTWIEKPPRGARHELFIKLENKLYDCLRAGTEFYIVRYNGKPYDKVVSLDFNSFAAHDFAMVKRWNSSLQLILLHDAFLRGCLFFDSTSTRNILTTYLSLV